MEGKLLGNRYELLEKIDGGGMSVVFKAKCRLLNRYVAVKILRPEFISDSEFIQRFKVESQAAASLSHPNIVPIYDVGNEDDIHYIVMEFIDGKTLKEYISEKKFLPWKTAVNIAIQICSALEHAHKNHIVHRDIKPHNIMITEDLIAKVTDFGIARAASSSTLTMTGNAIGSVHYFSPEQARGGYTDEKSDIYSLGIVLYEMLTGKVPFDAESPVSIALKHLEDEMIPPLEIQPDMPISINNIILKATQKNQLNRYQTASEMLQDLYTALKEPEKDFVKITNNSINNLPTQRLAIPNEIKSFNKNNGDIKNLRKGEVEESMGKNKSDRTTIIAALATSFIIILLISAFAGYFIYSKLTGKPSEMEAPNIVGMSVDDASELLKQSGVSLETIETRYDERAAKGIILMQKPESNIKIKVPGKIQVVVSDGQELVKVPDLTAMSLREAQNKLKDYSLTSRTTYEFNSQMLKGYVIRQSPSADSMVAINTEIEIFVSNGAEPNKIKVPNLVGMSEKRAKDVLKEKNLSVGDLKYDEDRSKPDGVVLSQSMVPNSEVDNSTPINIVVNKYIDNSQGITKDIYINLSNKGDGESFIVKVEIDGVMGREIVYQKRHTRQDKEIVVPVTGKGTCILRVYIDNKVDSEAPIDFGGEDQ